MLCTCSLYSIKLKYSLYVDFCTSKICTKPLSPDMYISLLFNFTSSSSDVNLLDDTKRSIHIMMK